MDRAEMERFEAAYTPIEKMVLTHAWNQHIRGWDIEDIRAEMRVQAWKAWLRWDPARGPYKVLWWSYWLNRKATLLTAQQCSKRSGDLNCVPFSECFHAKDGEEIENVKQLEWWDPDPEEEQPPASLECPLEDELAQRIWDLFLTGYGDTEICELLEITGWVLGGVKRRMRRVLQTRMSFLFLYGS